MNAGEPVPLVPPSESDLAALYKARTASLWVEDIDTKTYLDAVWGSDPDIGLLIAGGAAGVAAVVRDARSGPSPDQRVFGLRDRDVDGRSNIERWATSAGIELFVTDVFEIENYALVPDAIAASPLNTANVTSEVIFERLMTTARSMIWWLACCKTISLLRFSALTGFVERPTRRQASFDRQAALDHLLEADWIGTTASRVPAMATRERLTDRLDEHEKLFRRDLEGKTWLATFPGKELLIDIRQFVWRQKQVSGAQGRSDFLRSVAQAQRDSRTIPSALNRLRAAIRVRTGLSAPDRD